MYVYCIESFAHIECYSDCSRRGGAIWLYPFATVLFTMCSAVTVECCVLYPCLVCLRLCKEEGSSPVSAITEKRDMGCPRVCWVLG